MCVGSVCTHPPYNDKSQPSVFFFLIPINNNPFLKSSRSQILVCVTSHRPRPLPLLLIDTGVLPSTRPEWSVISPPLFRCRSRCRQKFLLSDWGVLFLDVIMNIAVIIYSRHLSRWRRSGILLFIKGMRLLIYIHASMFTQIIHDPASSSEEESIRFFYESLQIAFPNNVLVRKFHG